MQRENPSDAFVSNKYSSLEELPDDAVVGTCSLRRKCQLLAKQPGLQVRDLRGNVNTRLNKLDNGEYDAIILASAGLIRLGLKDRIRTEIDFKIMLPACAQGVVGVECKVDDKATNKLLSHLHHQDTADRVLAERTLNASLGGSCSTPIAAYAELNDDQISLTALLGQPDGSKILTASGTDVRANAIILGKAVAQSLIEQGGQEIIDQLPIHANA